MTFQVVLSGYVIKNIPKVLEPETVTRLNDYCVEHGITGLKLYTDGSFMSIFEGSEAAIRELINRYNKNQRISGVTILFEGFNDQAAFSDFKIGFREDEGPALTPSSFSLDANSFEKVMPPRADLWVKSLTNAFARINNVVA